MVVIRLAKSGAKKNPYFFITVADSRMPRDGRFIERLGFYNPSARGSEERLRFNTERFDHWVGQGAQVSDRVKVLHQEAEMSPEDLAAKFEKEIPNVKLKKKLKLQSLLKKWLLLKKLHQQKKLQPKKLHQQKRLQKKLSRRSCTSRRGSSRRSSSRRS